MDELRFADGHLPPEKHVVIHSELRKAITALVDKAKLVTCVPGNSSTTQTNHITPFFSIQGTPAQGSCTSCINACQATFAGCGVGAGIVAVLCPWCGAGIGAACAAIYLGCTLDCVYSSSFCCPVKCESGLLNILNPGDGCCDFGEHCVAENDPNAVRQGCCTSNQNVCSNKCCAVGERCDKNTDKCCNPVSTCSAGTCCEGTCIEGTCCPSTSLACSHACCDSFAQCTNIGTCCGFTNELCPGDPTGCCNSGEQCINNNCCPGDQVCGSVCCAAGEVCNPTTHACMSLQCTGGHTPCPPLDGGTPICCDPGVTCCQGQCCPSNEYLCDCYGVPGCSSFGFCIG